MTVDLTCVYILHAVKGVSLDQQSHVYIVEEWSTLTIPVRKSHCLVSTIFGHTVTTRDLQIAN